MQLRDDVREHHRDDRRQPHEDRERRLEVHLVGVAVAGLGDRLVDQVRHAARDDHHDAHHEDPDEQLDLDRRHPARRATMNEMSATPVTP